MDVVLENKVKRLEEVYDHLRKYFPIHNKTDMAEACRCGRAGLYSAFGGNEKYLTDKLFQKICSAYPGVFDLDYLLTGEGHLLTIEEELKCQEIENAGAANRPSQSAPIPDYVQRLCDEATRISTRCEMLERQLSLALADNRELKSQLNLSLVSIEGMKNQLASVLSLFNSPKTMQRIQSVAMVNDTPDYATAVAEGPGDHDFKEVK